jgi:hypothetical protein
MRKMVKMLITALLISSSAICHAQDNTPPLVEPTFLLGPNPAYCYYRPVLNATADKLIFEISPIQDCLVDANTILYIVDLPTETLQPFVPSLSESTGPDWCWYRSREGLTSGPVAFSSDAGIYTVASIGAQPVLLPITVGMAYPAWYPSCQYIAVDMAMTAPRVKVNAEIDANTGTIVVPDLANETVWAGFPSVNQANPQLVAFAGQFNGENNYYDQDLNYAWVTNRSTTPPNGGAA